MFGYQLDGDTDYAEIVSFPLRAPANVTNTAVSFDDSVFTAGAAENSEENSACTGTVSNPTAPAGNVCLYLEGYNVFGDSATGDAFVPGLTQGSRLGFSIEAAASTAPTGTYLAGTWAYRAP